MLIRTVMAFISIYLRRLSLRRWRLIAAAERCRDALVEGVTGVLGESERASTAFDREQTPIGTWTDRDQIMLVGEWMNERVHTCAWH